MTSHSTARTDAHSPLNLVTEDYEYIWAYDSESPGALRNVAGTDWWNEICANRANVHDGAQCDHCGAWIRYRAILKHVPTGQYIQVGETCLDNRFGRASADFHALRKQAALDRKEQKILKAWNEYKETHTVIDVLDKNDNVLYSHVNVLWDALAESTNGFIINVLHKGRQYGNLSDRQLNAIVRSFLQDIEKAFATPEPEEIWLDVPTVKAFTVEGVVLAEKWQDSDYGPQHKCLVKVDVDGGSLKLWGSVPKSLEGEWKHQPCDKHPNGIETTFKIDGKDTTHFCQCQPALLVGEVHKGDKVRFVANIEPSRNDSTFGIFKRPRKASIVKEVAA